MLRLGWKQSFFGFSQNKKTTCFILLQLLYQLCRRHDCGGSHHQTTMRQSTEVEEMPGHEVEGQQSPPEYGEDQGDSSELEERVRPASSIHQWCCSRAGEQRPIQWWIHYISGQKSPTDTLVSVETGKSGSPNPPSWTPTEAPLKASWPAASLCGTIFCCKSLQPSADPSRPKPAASKAAFFHQPVRMLNSHLLCPHSPPLAPHHCLWATDSHTHSSQDCTPHFISAHLHYCVKYLLFILFLFLIVKFKVVFNLV